MLEIYTNKEIYIIIIINLTPIEQSYAEFLLFAERKPYYNCSRVKTSPIVTQNLCSLAANAY